MWVFLRNAFLSIVEDRADFNRLMVRARIRGDIERVFPNAAIIEMDNADYRFRAFINREEVANAIMGEVLSIDYPDFKSRVAVDDPGRKGFYSEVWGVMNRAQSHYLTAEGHGEGIEPWIF